MALAQFSITATPGGGQVIIDGQDVSGQVTALRLEAAGHQVPQLTLQLIAGGDLSGLAEIVVERQAAPDGEVIAAFLSALDPEQLEKDVLTGLGALEGDGETSFTQALLKRLATIAKGEW